MTPRFKLLGFYVDGLNTNQDRMEDENCIEQLTHRITTVSQNSDFLQNKDRDEQGFVVYSPEREFTLWYLRSLWHL